MAGTGVVEMAHSEPEAAASILEEAIAIFKRCGEDYGAAVSRAYLGSVLLALGEGERAQRSFEEATGVGAPREEPHAYPDHALQPGPIGAD